MPANELAISQAQSAGDVARAGCRLCSNGRGASPTGWQEEGDKQGNEWERKGKKSKWTANAASGLRRESRQHMEQQTEDEVRQQTQA